MGFYRHPVDIDDVDCTLYIVAPVYQQTCNQGPSPAHTGVTMHHHGPTIRKNFVEFDDQSSESLLLPSTEVSDGMVALFKAALVDVADDIISSPRNHLFDRHQSEYNFNSMKRPFIENEGIWVVSEGTREAASMQHSEIRFYGDLCDPLPATHANYPSLMMVKTK